jgi:hypothetical protein
MAVEEATPAWLSAVLDTPVTAVEVTATDAFNSRTVRIHVRYADRGHRPTWLVLKRNGTASWAVEAGRREALFYLFAGELTPRPPSLVPCLAAGVDELTGESFVLMPDLSATHAPPVSRTHQIALRGVPSERRIGACITALARHHAYWWNHPELTTGRFDVGSWSRDEDRVAAYGARRRAAWTSLDWTLVEAEVAALCERVRDGIEAHARANLTPRFVAPRHLTLAHGDSYFANFLCRRDGDDALLLDWQSPEVDHAGNDLALLLASFWTPDQRHEHDRETRCLRLYHRVLVDNGVDGYSWGDLLTDYRSGLLYWLLMPVQDAADGSPPTYWLPKLRCLAAAARDWAALDLVPS